jgi:hypothetical protein
MQSSCCVVETNDYFLPRLVSSAGIHENAKETSAKWRIKQKRTRDTKHGFALATKSAFSVGSKCGKFNPDS